MTKEELLLSPVWSYKHICEYVGCKTTKAIELKKIAVKQFGGAVKYLPNMVKRNAVLELLGTTFDTEIKAIRKEKNEETLQG